MCGIAGIVGRGDEWPKVACSELVGRLLDAQAHRGPDDSGIWEFEGVCLGHRRLAILDLSHAGHQPMVDPQSGCSITFNGEIYNFQELRAELERVGRTFRSHTDTEVILQAYATWGKKFVERLDGMFAFVICDPVRRSLLFARDHVGIKPLYYSSASNGALAWASEVRALALAGLTARTLNRRAISGYLRLGSIQEPDTIFEGVRAFPPGSIAEVSIDRPSPFTSECYWCLSSFFGAARGAAADHAAMLQRTVTEQLAADVPVGVFLSAGVDSSALAAMAARVTSGRLTAFTIASGEDEMDESAWASGTAAALGLPHNTRKLDAPTSAAWIPQGLAAMDQPSCDGINTYLVSRASRESGMVVALAGTGADELHGGYGHFSQLVRVAHLLANPISRLALSPLLSIAGLIPSGRRVQLLAGCYPSIFEMLNEKRRFFTPEWIQSHAPEWPDVRPEIHSSPGCAEDQISAAEIGGYLRNTLLRDSDWATMANSQELRVPFLGRRYIEYMASLPWSAKSRRNGVNKPLIVAALPVGIRHALSARPKTGFNLDFVSLITGTLRESLHEAVEALLANGFHLRVEDLLVSLEKTRSQKMARRIWALLALGHYIHRHTAR